MTKPNHVLKNKISLPGIGLAVHFFFRSLIALSTHTPRSGRVRRSRGWTHSCLRAPMPAVGYPFLSRLGRKPFLRFLSVPVCNLT